MSPPFGHGPAGEHCALASECAHTDSVPIPSLNCTKFLVGQSLWEFNRVHEHRIHMSTVFHSIASTLMASISIPAAHNALVPKVFRGKVFPSTIRRYSFLHNFGAFPQGARRSTLGIRTAWSWDRIHFELTQYSWCWLLTVDSFE